LCKGTAALDCENHTGCTTTVCGHNAEYLALHLAVLTLTTGLSEHYEKRQTYLYQVLREVAEMLDGCNMFTVLVIVLQPRLKSV